MEESTQILQFVRFTGILPAILVLVVSWMASRFVASFAEGLGERFTQRRLLFNQIATVGRLIIYFGGGFSAVALAFSLTRDMWLVAGGTIAVALGFAFKDFAASIVAGLMIIIDRPFQVGDRITFGGFYGTVQRIGLRSVRLVTLDDNLVTIPNNKFITEPVASGNAGALDMLVQMDFHIGIDQPIETAKAIVRDALTSSRYAYIEKPWAIIVNEVIHDGYFAVRIRAKAYVLDIVYEKAFETDVTERVHRGFRRQGIEPPALLHRDVDHEERDIRPSPSREKTAA